MALNIKNERVDRLARDVARLSGESLTEAIRRALEERLERLRASGRSNDREGRLLRFLEQEAWPSVPAGELGRRLTKDEEEAILGYGDNGF